MFKDDDFKRYKNQETEVRIYTLFDDESNEYVFGDSKKNKTIDFGFCLHHCRVETLPS